MSNNLNSLNPTLWQSSTQDYLNNMLVAKAIAMTKFETGLQWGSAIEFPQLSNLYLEDYTPGVDLTPQPLAATSSQLLINRRKAAAIDIDDIEKFQARTDYQIALSKQLAYQLANEMDATLLATGCTGAALTSTNSSTLSASSMLQVMLDADTSLQHNRAYSNGMQKFAVMGPKFKNLLASTFIANGFKSADSTLRNGFDGYANGFDCYTSNNLPTSVGLTLAAQPTANDTFTIFGVTFKFVGNGTAASAGDISIGATLSATQAIVKDAINNTGTPGVATYIQVSQDNLATLKNALATASAWVSNVSTITGAGYMGQSETFTSSSNVFGTPTSKILFGVKGAIALGAQMEPTIFTDRKPLQAGVYLKGLDLYGTKVFSKAAYRLYALTVNA